MQLQDHAKRVAGRAHMCHLLQQGCTIMLNHLRYSTAYRQIVVAQMQR